MFVLTLFLCVCLRLTSSCSTSKQLIVASIPDNPYYKNSFADIEDFVRQLGEKTAGLDDFLVVYSKSRDDQYKQSTSGYPFGDEPMRLVVNSPLDLWMRDFTSTTPERQVKFTYRSGYLPWRKAVNTENDFLKMLRGVGVSVVKSRIVLDGGNVVDNKKDKAIISERVLDDNENIPREDLKYELEQLLGMKVALIPQTEGDTTGHSDGLVSFIADNVLLIGDYQIPGYYDAIENAVKSEFPELKIVRMPCGKRSPADKQGSNWRGFSTAIGSYVNLLMTNNALYVPQFGNAEYDKQAVDIVRAHTDKPVVTIDTSRLSHMGGSVRCLTWQMESWHHIAQALCEHSEED